MIEPTAQEQIDKVQRIKADKAERRTVTIIVITIMLASIILSGTFEALQ